MQVSRQLESHLRRRSLWRGLLAPGVMTVMAGLLLAAAAIAVLQWAVISGAYSVVPVRYLLRDSHDDYLVVSHTVASLKRGPSNGVPVYVLGGSVTNEMIETPEGLATQLEELTGNEVSVYWLASFAQSFGQSLAILDNLPRRPGLVVIAVSPSRFVYHADRNEDQVVGKPFLLHSEALFDVVVKGWRRRLPANVWPGIADFLATYGGFVFNGLRSGVLPPLEYKRHRYADGDQLPLASKRELVRLGVERGMSAIREHFPDNAPFLERSVALARQRDYVVVVLEMPRDEQAIGGDWDEGLAVYQPFCREVAARYGGVYLDFSQDVGLVSADFADLFHLVEPGRAKWQRRLAAELAPWVRMAAAAGGVGERAPAVRRMAGATGGTGAP